MKRALLSLVIPGLLSSAARPAAAVEPSALCQEVARLVEARDFLGAQRLTESARGTDGHILRARALVTALSADFSFLSEFRGQYADDAGPCPRDDRQHLEESLRARADRAHDLLRDARDLPPWDRAAAELILTWAAAGAAPPAATVDELERGAQDFLRRFPDSAYRRFFLGSMIRHYDEAVAAFELEGFGAMMGLVGQAGRDLQPHPGGGGGIGYLEGAFRVGLQALATTATLRQDLPDRGPDWVAGRRPSWLAIEATAGYRPTWGRHGALAVLGLGYAHLHLDRGEEPPVTLSYGQASLGVGYDFAFRARQPPRGARDTEWHQPGLLLRAQLVGFATAGASGVAPAGALLRIGFVVEDRIRERIVE